MVTTTTVYSFQKPDVSGDEDAWGGYLNANIDKYESILTGNTTITSVVITTADINGGTLDNVVIGGSTAAAVTGTTITGTGFASTGNMTFGDNNKAIFGASTNLEIYANGGYSYIDEVGANNLNIRTNGANIGVYDTANSQYMAKFTTGGDAELYHNGSEKLATTSTGVDVTGTVTATGGAFTGNITLGDNNKAIFGAGSDLSIFHDGSHSYISDQGTGNLRILAGEFNVKSASGNTDLIYGLNGGAVTLYHNGNAKIATTSTGVDISGDLNAVDNIVLATAMYHEGDTDTFLSFGSGGDSINLVTGGAARLSATNSGVQLGDTGNGYFQPVSGDYGSIQIDGGAHTGYEGYSIGGRIVLMHDNSNTTYLFNDVDNEAFIKMTNNGAVQLYHNGTSKIATTSTGIDVTGTVTADLLNVTSGSSADNIVQVFGGGTIYAGLGVDGTGAIITAGSSGSADAALIIKTSASGTETERMRISADGSVGIGDSAPVSTLEISKSDQTNGTTLTITNAFSGGSWAVDDVIGSIDFRSDDASSSELTRGRIQSVTDNVTGTNWSYGTALTFSTAFNNTLSERLRINSNGDVLIGTTTSGLNSQLTVEGTAITIRSGTTGNGNLFFSDGTSGNERYRGYIYYSHSTDHLGLGVSGFEAMRINSSGDVGIGTTAPSSSSTYRYLDIVGGATNTGGVLQLRTSDFSANFQAYSSSVGGILGTTTNHGLIFTTNNSTRMVLDASGNLLVGTTDTSLYNNSGSGEGMSYFPSQFLTVATSGQETAIFNRLSSDGTIVQFRKDGSSVGSIGTTGGDLTIFSATASHGGIRFAQSGLLPTDNTGALSDATRDIGQSDYRWKDIYATNGTIQTSDRNEKQDIAELTDAEQRVAVAAKGLLRKFRWKTAVAEKGDAARTHFGIIAQDLQAAFAAEGLDAGDYAMFISTTWTDEETGEEKTRMGVRYSELLAFIIAAI